jgi:hypothetical protein
MNYNHILVCLDLSTYDNSCIKKSIILANKLKGVKKITYFHNIKFDFLNKLAYFNEDQLADLVNKIKEDLDSRIDHFRRVIDITLEVLVTTDSSTIQSIFTNVTVEESLVLMGLKKKDDGKAILPLKYLRYKFNTAPLLLIPKSKENIWKNILIASQLKTLHKYYPLLSSLQSLDSKIRWLRIIKTPVTYFPYLNIEKEEFISQSLKNDEIKISNFDIEVIERKAPNVANEILGYIEDRELGLVIMSKNESVSLSSNIGSNTLKVIQANEKVPMLVI